jgi:hypothetical protein
MAELKTKQNEENVNIFLKTIEDEQKRNDSLTILELMKKITGEEPKMWGASIVGFGSYHYKYASGREGDWFLTGFSPRKQAITLYMMDYVEKHQAVLENLGKFKHGKGCLYVKKLEDIDLEVLEKLIKISINELRKAYPRQ